MAGSRLMFSLCLLALLGMSPLLGGCATEQKVYTATDAAGEMPVGVPPTAKLLWGGKNDKLDWKFGSTGHYWMVDDSDGRTLIDGDVQAGDELEIDPKAHLVELNHAFLDAKTIAEDLDLRLYFAVKAATTENSK